MTIRDSRSSPPYWRTWGSPHPSSRRTAGHPSPSRASARKGRRRQACSRRKTWANRFMTWPPRSGLRQRHPNSGAQGRRNGSAASWGSHSAFPSLRDISATSSGTRAYPSICRKPPTREKSSASLSSTMSPGRCSRRRISGMSSQSA